MDSWLIVTRYETLNQEVQTRNHIGVVASAIIRRSQEHATILFEPRNTNTHRSRRARLLSSSLVTRARIFQAGSATLRELRNVGMVAPAQVTRTIHQTLSTRQHSRC